MSWVIWISGSPDGERSAVARAAAAELQGLDPRSALLELDEIRKIVTPSPRGTERELYLVGRTLAYLAGLLSEHGVPLIIDASTLGGGWRDLARATIPRFAEVEIGAGESVAEATARAVRLARELTDAAAFAAEAVVRTPAAPGWAIWITGRPGSGKSTLARRVCDALAARALRACILDHAGARRFLVGNGAPVETDEDIVHRALAYAAKRLTEAGLPVIVDATAPRRAWREAARALIPTFAEVQLLCPVEVGLERERAVHWGLSAGREVRPPATASEPHIVLAYEDSFRPDLMLRTDLHEAWDSVEQILALVHRLSRGRNRRRDSLERTQP
ncbi:MAG TPA: adenylyl-sulfate kinase [Pseudomonadales bacterium]|nr:adenylyl-sulfate kinase [Pseudomonadales bacterium]